MLNPDWTIIKFIEMVSSANGTVKGVTASKGYAYINMVLVSGAEG